MKRSTAILNALPFIFLFFLFFLPLAAVFVGSLSGAFGGREGGSPLLFLTAPYYRRVLWFSLFQAFISTLFSLALGLPGAYILSHYRFPGGKILRALSIVPFILPSVLVVIGFVLFFGNNGYINRGLAALFDLEEPPLKILYSFKAIILAHGFYNFPVCLRLVTAAWEKSSRTRIDAARSLGARKLRLFFTVSIHDILPALLSSAVLIFLFCFLSFAVILVLGGGPRYTTMEVEIYRLLKMNVDFRSAAFLSIIQSFFSLSIIFIYLRLQRRSGAQDEMTASAGHNFPKGRAGPIAKTVLMVYAGLMIILIGGPIISVIIQSFLQRRTWSGGLHVTLNWYREIFSPSRTGAGAPLTGIRNSLFFGLTSALLSLALGTVLAGLLRRLKSRAGAVLETMVMLPMGISSVVLGLSYLVISRFLQGPGSGLNGLFIIFAHTIITYPFVLRTMQAAFSKIGPSMKEAAVSLGASSGAVFRTIEFPLLRSSLISAASFAFAISIGEINATIMLAGSELVTIPIVMLRLISSYNFFAACALGTLLILVTSSVFFIFEKFGGERS